MANLEVIALDTATPQLKAPQAGDGYAMPRPVTVTEVVGSTALTLTGAIQTTSQPIINATQTWNNVATTFTGIKFNVTDTTSVAASLFMDLQASTVSKFQVRKDGSVQIANTLWGGNGASPTWYMGGTGPVLGSGRSVQWSSAATFTSFSTAVTDLILSRKAAANLQHGEADAAAPVAQTIGVQSVVAGTSNTAGAAFTIRGSQGTGTGVGGSILFQTAPVGTTGTAQNPLITPLTIGGDGSISFTPPSGRAVSLSANRIFQYGAGTPEGVSFGNFTGGYGFICGPTALVCFAPVTAFAGNPDVIITRKAAATLQHGAADAAAPVAQTIGVQSVVAGTSNIAGANFTIAGSQGTGTGVGGNIIFQVAPAGTAGTAQNTLATAMTVYNTKTVAVGVAFTVATLPAAGTQGRRAWVTDATAPTFLGALTGGGAVVSPVFDNGTAWVAG